MKKDTYDKTLALVNKILAKHGKKPVEKLSAGKPADERSCPISQTLKDGSFSGHDVRTTHHSIGIDGVVETEDYDDQDVVNKFTDEVDNHEDEDLLDPIDLVEKEEVQE